MARNVTLEDIEKLDKEMLVPTDIAPYLGCCAYSINVATEDGKNPFPFPVIRMGRRVRIPKRPFIQAMRGISVRQMSVEGAKKDDSENQDRKP